MAKHQSKKETRPQQQTKTAVKEGNSFLRFLWAKDNRIELLIVLGLQMALFVFLKIRFPYPLTESDSGNYILSATTGKINGYRPYGYSAFLRFFTTFSTDVTFVSTWQFFIAAIAVFLVLFSVKYFFNISRIPFLILAVLLLFNPSILYMNVYLMSDGLFVALTALWLTTGLWLLNGGPLWMILVHILLLYFCIDTRYIGMFYAGFSALFIAYRFLPNKALAGVGFVLPFLLLFWYRNDQTGLMLEEYGVDTFSSFGGWQKANNAVAVLPFVKVDENQLPSPQIKSLHQVVRSFPDSLFTFPNVEATNFMWVKSHPGKAFLFQYIQQTGVPYMKAWAYCGTLMEQYGEFLQSHYRTEYVKHYILENAKNIFKVWEIMEGNTFNADQNMKNLFTCAVDKYEYKTPFFKTMTSIRTIGDGVVWLVLLVSLIVLLVMFKRIVWSNAQKLMLLSLILFLLAFLAVSVYAAPINNFRYLMPIYYAQILIPFLILVGLLKQKQV